MTNPHHQRRVRAVLKGTPHKQNEDLTMDIIIERIYGSSDYVISSEGDGLGYRVDAVCRHGGKGRKLGGKLSLEGAMKRVESFFGVGAEMTVHFRH